MEIIHTFNPDRVSEIISHLETLTHNLSKDKSSYAKDRKVFWLNQEPSFGKETFYKPGIQDDRLWNFIQKITSSKANCALAAKGAGIDWHRDASYAAPEAWLLNLGPAVWEFNPDRNGKPSDSNIIRAELVGGELIRFNCKHLHRAIASQDRWAIGIWQPK